MVHKTPPLLLTFGSTLHVRRQDKSFVYTEQLFSGSHKCYFSKSATSRYVGSISCRSERVQGAPFSSAQLIHCQIHICSCFNTMSLSLSLQVSIVRFLLSYNDQAERQQKPEPPSPAFVETIPSGSPRKYVHLHFYTPTDFDNGKSNSPRKYPVVIDFHGGGFSTGVSSMDARWAGALLRTSAHPVVIGVDYSLAPKYPFPAALQDAAAAVFWCMHQGAEKHNLDPTKIVLSGFSAGGTLSLTAPMWITDGAHSPSPNEANGTGAVQQLPHPLRGIVSIYPRVDYREPWVPAGSRLTRFLNNVWAKAYPGDAPLASPFLSPAAADDRLIETGLPQSISLYTVEDDWLLETCESFRARLTALGKTVRGDVEPGEEHAWDKMPIPKTDTTRWMKRDAWYARMATDVEQMLC